MCREQKLNENNLKDVTVKELASHNTPKDSWCAIYDGVYDITKFAKRHPGGDVILLASGRDATVLFESYHPRGVPKQILAKIKIGEMKQGEIPSSFYSFSSNFYPTLKLRVVERLDSLNLPLRGGPSIQIKAVMLLSTFWFSLFQMCLSSFTVAMYWSALLGFSAAMIGVCIQHDGNHGAYSVHQFWNKLAGWTLDMIGASAFTWEFQHMLGHHPYTNLLDIEEKDYQEKGIDRSLYEIDQESDPDVFSSFPLIRMHPSHDVYWYNRYQHIYSPLLFSFMTLSKVFEQDYSAFFKLKLFHIDTSCRYKDIKNCIRFWLMKILTSIYMVIIPMYIHGFVKGFTLFLLAHCICGQTLATMFIVNHVIDGVAFAEKTPEEQTNKQPRTLKGATSMDKTCTKNIPLNDWAAVQCQTSVNWSSGSWFWNHFSGGLCHQIEHHLFPSICHTNYVYIHDVVHRTCQEFGVPYQNESNLAIAYKHMIRHLYLLGNGLDKKMVKKHP